MPNAAEYYARIAATENPIQSGLERLTANLVGIHERKLERARQAEMDRLAAEREARAAQTAEDERQLQLFAIKQALEAQKPTAPVAKTFEQAQTAEVAPGKAPMMTPDTPEERAAFVPPTPGPSLTIGGQTLAAPSQAEIQARQAEDFALNLVRKKEEQEALEPTIEIPGRGRVPIRALPGIAALERAGELGEDFTLGPGQIRFRAGKEVARGPAERPAVMGAISDTGLSPTANRNLTGITTKFQADTVMAQAGQGATIKAIADQVLADPKSAPNQLKSLYILVKNLDPTSAVREGELALAQATQSYQQQWGNVLDRVNQGVVISPQAAAQLATATKEIASLWDIAAQRRQKQYQAQAGVLGVGPQFDDYLSRFSSPGAEPAVPATGGALPAESQSALDRLFPR